MFSFLLKSTYITKTPHSTKQIKTQIQSMADAYLALIHVMVVFGISQWFLGREPPVEPRH